MNIRSLSTFLCRAKVTGSYDRRAAFAAEFKKEFVCEILTKTDAILPHAAV